MKNEELEVNNRLPIGWVYAGLEDISDIDRHSIKRGPFGSALKKEFFVPEGYKVYEQGNVINNDFDRGTYFINDEKFEDLKSFSIKPKDILMSCAGTVGKLAIVPDGVKEGVINQALLKLSVHPDIDLQYFFKLLSYQIDEILKSNLRGSAMMNLTSVKDLKLVKFSIAPLNEQKRIVAKIEKLFSNLDNSDKYLLHLEKQLKRYRQSVLKSAFEGELTKEWREKQTNLETADELLEKIKIERTLYIENEIREKFKDKTEKWIKDKVKIEVDKFDNVIKKASIFNNNFWINIPLEAITTLLGDGLHGTPKYVESSEYYFINGNNLQQGKIVIKSDTKFVSQEEYLKYKKNMNNNTILVSINGTLGNVAFYDNEQVMLGKSACYFNLINSINKYYIFWKINSQDFREYADKSATGSTIKNLPLSAMRNYKLPICSILEQQEIVNQIEKHFSIIDKLETVVQQSIKESKRLRQSILKQAFEGKLVEQDPNDESASLLLEKIAKAKEEYQKAMKRKK